MITCIHHGVFAEVMEYRLRLRACAMINRQFVCPIYKKTTQSMTQRWLSSFVQFMPAYYDKLTPKKILESLNLESYELLFANNWQFSLCGNINLNITLYDSITLFVVRGVAI